MSNQEININTDIDSIKDLDNDRRASTLIANLHITKFQNFYKEEFMKKFNFNKMSNIKNKEIDLLQSSMKRSDTLRLMKERYQYNTMDTIVIVMKLYDYKTRQETNYGTLFCELEHTVNPERKKISISKQAVGNVIFTFFSATPSYISQDGEYRSQFLLYLGLRRSKEEFVDIWDDIDEYINKIRKDRGWSLFTSYFYPKMEQESRNNEVEYKVKSEFLDILLLCIAWFNVIFDEMIGLKKNHVNEKFIDIFLRESEKDILFIKDLINKYTLERIEKFRNGITYHSMESSIYNSININCGYKMVPLNIKEVQDPLKLKYKPWREFFISNRCNDLIINNIAPNYSFILDWFYIKNSRKGLFDNTSQYDKMKNSEIAKGILQILYEAQRNTYFISENINNKSQKNIKEWFNSKFKKLNEKIDDSINYSMEEIIMSEVTLGFVNEYIGRTIADSINMTQKSKKYDKMLCYPFKESGYRHFAKYMFDICYGLFCLNSKLNIIHGDLHLNNATIGKLYQLNESIITHMPYRDENIDKSNILYVIDDNHQYIFPNNGFFGCIIDFSRSIINPINYLNFTDKSLPISYKLVENEDKFVSGEILNLLKLYLQMYPNKIKQQEELTVLFKNYFDAVFKLLTAVDIYMLTLRMLRSLQHLPPHNVSKKSMGLLEKINNMAESFITTEMNNLIYEPEKYNKKILEEDYPLLKIIKTCFAEFNNLDLVGVISDVYCYSNKMEYSLNIYDSMPDYMKYIKAKINNKIVELKYFSKRKKKLFTEFEKQKIHNLDMVNYIATRHKQKLF